ncbi:MAG: hypothetical protein GY754_21395 [bacterium]|nr:hypothetical protein [bacterium]
MLSKNIIAVNFLILCIVLSLGACSTMGNTSQKNPYTSNYLPASGTPDQVAAHIEMVCTIQAPYDDKVRAFQLALDLYKLDNGNSAYAILFAKTAFLLADIEPGENKMLYAAEQGKNAVAALNATNKNPLASYYFALNLGLIVRAKGLFALDQVPHIEKALKTAGRKPDLDQGGPLRVLGMLYLKAPAWPNGIGDLDRSLELLKKASANFSSHPLNHIFYARALIEEDRTDEARAELTKAGKLVSVKQWGSVYAERWKKEIAELREEMEE